MTPVVIMAGGYGTRLHGLTEHLPKPLIAIGGKPMLETMIEDFIAQGFRKFYLTVHYRAPIIEAYFGDGSRFGCSIRYLEETEPQGTAGGLRALPDMEVPFIVANCDIRAAIRYGELMEFHAQHNAQATAAIALYQHQVPYGVADVDEDMLLEVKEKPIHNFPVLAGVYVLEPSAIAHIPAGPYNMPDLLESLDTVAAFPVKGFWHDVGHFEDLTHATQAQGAL